MEYSKDRTGPQFFEVRTFKDGGSWRLALSGELDLSSADQLEDAIRQAEEGDGLRIVVDLSDLEFMDSTGLGILLSANARSRENGHRLSFRPSRHEAVTRLLDLTQTKEILDPH
jgi:anti-sigma B factor antagonist